MKYPNFNEEKKLWKQGYKFVIGLDEAGRGPLAGPVVAAAVMIRPEHLKIGAWRSSEIFKKNFGLRDSKKLSAKQREYFYNILVNHPQIKWGIGVVSERVIDKVNIFNATKMAMRKALNDLYHNFHGRENYGTRDFILIDGNFALNNLNVPQKSIIAADKKVFSCAAAGIIAKVTRDRIMQKMHKKYPQYGFNLHKGYGTRLHMKNLQNLGPCKIHRKSFYPVSIYKS